MREIVQNLTSTFNEFLIKITYGLEGFKYKDKLLGSSVLLINFIQANPKCSMTDIRDFLKVTPSTATRRIDKLVDLGLLQRSIGDIDHRSIELCLTSEGKDLFQHYQEKRFKGLQNLTKKFNDGEIKSFLSVLEFFIVVSDDFLNESISS